MSAPEKKSARVRQPRPLIRYSALLAAGLSCWLLLSGMKHPSPPETDAAHISSLCGTTEDRLQQVLTKNEYWQSLGIESLPTTQSFDIGEIAVLEDDGTLLQPAGGSFELDVVAAARAFYQTHGDDYDFLSFYVASDVDFAVIPGTGAFAFEVNVVQDVQGIGLGLWDYSNDFGSSGRLHSLLNLNSLSAYPANPLMPVVGSNNTLDVLAHEAGHRWVAFARNDSAGETVTSLLGAGFSHWNFYLDNQASMLWGNDWRDNLDGSWTTIAATERFGDLELYLMGFLAAGLVSDFVVLQAPANCTPPADYTRNHNPLVGVTCDASPYTFTVNDVIAANGPRVPSVSTSPKNQRFAFALVIANGTAPTQSDLDKLENIRSMWPLYFSNLVSGLATADPTLDSQAGDVVVDHDGLKDTENTAAPYVVDALVGIEQGSIPLTVDPSSVTLRFGVNGGSLIPAMMTEVTAGQYQADIPALPSGSSVRYQIFASSDSLGIDTWWPGPSAASTHTFAVGLDSEPPAVSQLSQLDEIKHGLSPYRFYAQATDNLGVDRVVATYQVNGGAPDSLDFTRVGSSDTFYVDLNPTALLGDQLDLTVRAIDAAAAANESVSPDCAGTGVCQFLWGVSWHEPLDLSNGGFVPEAVTAGFRDSWLWTDQDDFTGRASWKCGDPGALNYVQHLDAALVTPPIPVTQYAELRFRHRYDIEDFLAGQSFDGALVEMSEAGGPWQPITPAGGYPRVLTNPTGTALPAGTPVYGGRSAGWENGDFVQEVFLLPALDSTTVQFRFRMSTDGSVGGIGWFVDDVKLIMHTAGVEVAGGSPAGHFRLRVPQPNPARDRVLFRADVPSPAWLRLEVYDIRGRLVARPFAGRVPGGAWSLPWRLRGHGTHSPGPDMLSPGVYLARVRLQYDDGRTTSEAQRFVLLR